MNKDDSLKNLLSESLIIAVVPLVAYATAMAYEAGYNSNFNIPLEVISISSVNIFIAIGFILSVFFLILIFAQGLFSIFGKTIPIPGTIKNVLIERFLPLFLLLLISIIINGIKQWHSYSWLAAILIVWTIIDFIPPLFRKDRTKSYVEHFESTQELEAKKFHGSEILVQNILNSLGIKFQNINILLFCAILFIYSGYGLGKRNAQEQEYFFVDKDKPNIVYLKFYSDKIISSQYNCNESTTSELTINKMPPDNTLTLIKKKIGPLKYKDN